MKLETIKLVIGLETSRLELETTIKNLESSVKSHRRFVFKTTGLNGADWETCIPGQVLPGLLDFLNQELQKCINKLEGL